VRPENPAKEIEMKLRVVLALCGLVVLFPAIHAQEEKKEAPKKGPQLDETSKKLLSNWDKCVYHLGRQGVKKASCKVKFTMSQMGQETVVNFNYKWDGTKGTLECDNPQMAAMIAQGGVQAQFDSEFRDEPFEKQLGTAKCTATATETGHVIKIEGKTKAGFKSITFDKEGVLTDVALDRQGQMGQQRMKMKFAYTKLDGKYLVSAQTGEMGGGMGQMSLDIKFTYAKVGDYQVKQKQVTNILMGGARMGGHTMEFSDWKLNDDVDGAKPAEPEKTDPK
jgi:hypothetical protein